MIESGVIRYGDKFKEAMAQGKWDLSLVDPEELKKSQATLVYGQMNEPPGARASVALSGLTVAEGFRDGGGKDGGAADILFFIDNIFRFTQAGSEVSALLGRMPSAVGYQPTLASEMGTMQERITSTKSGSITSVQAVYVPADDLTDPAPATTFTHLDATTVLDRKIAELGIYPAVDPLASNSRILDPNILSQDHYNTAQKEGKEKSKGMEAVPTVEGNLLLGPTERQDEVCDYRTDGRDLEQLTGDAKQLLPQLDLAVIRSFSAVRPRAFETGEEGEERADCFRVWAPEGIPGFFSMTGIVTPGLTCARELGADAAAQIAVYLDASENPAFRGERREPFMFRRLSAEEQQALAPSGRTDIICRCEKVTREEILRAIHAKPGAVTLDGIKRRTCAGMGRCQGQRCMTEIMKILANEQGIPLENVEKDGPGSRILAGPLREEA